MTSRPVEHPRPLRASSAGRFSRRGARLSDRSLREVIGRLGQLAGLELTVDVEGSAVIEAPKPWVERLLGRAAGQCLHVHAAWGRVEVTVLSHADGMRLLVVDSGPGVAPEQRGRIFERFYWASAPDQGAGLWLAPALQP